MQTPNEERSPMALKLTVQDEMLTLAEAAEVSGMSTFGIRRWITEGKLPAARYRSRYVISKVVLAMTVAAVKEKSPNGRVAENLEMSDMLTEAGVARELGISRQRVHQLIERGKIRSVRIAPRIVRVSRDAVDEFKQLRETGTAEGIDVARDALLTTEEVADELRVSVETVKSLIARGELSALRIGNRYRVKQSTLRGYLRRSKVRVEPPNPRFGKEFTSVPKITRTTTCSLCNIAYPLGGFGEHIQIAEHVRARALKNGYGSV